MHLTIKISQFILPVIFGLFLNLSIGLASTSPKVTKTANFSSTLIIDSSCPRNETFCEGRCTWSDGSIYDGEFRNGLPEGYGEQNWTDGSYYEGEFANGFRHGKGTQVLDNGDQYIGQFTNGYMNGKGIYIWANGTRYEGGYKKDKLHGYGKIQFPNGASYAGEWKNGKAHGKGTYTMAGGARFKGNYKKGKRHGKGIIIWNDGAILNGNWYNGFLVKEGLFKFEDGDGFWANWKLGSLTGKVKYNHATKGEFITVAWADLMDQLNTREKANMAIVHYFMAIEYQFDKDYKKTISHLEGALQLLDEKDPRYDAIHLELVHVKQLLK